jgi:GT2 family glycosyltransferase
VTLSRLAQLPERPSVIVVDNASVDGTPQAVAGAFPDVTTVSMMRDIGPAARTVGVERADTEVVAFSDDDSWWAPGSLGRAVEVLAAHPSVGLIAGRVLVGPERRLDATSAAMGASPLPRRPGLPGAPVLGFMACASIVRRSAFLQVGGFSAPVIGGEEELLALDLAAAGWDLIYLADVLAYHHPSGSRDPSARVRALVTNELRTAWLRRPLRHALRRTLGAVRRVPEREVRLGLLDVVRDFRAIRRDRRRVPSSVELALRRLESLPAARPSRS